MVLQKILSSSPPLYTIGFSCGGVKDNLTHCVHSKRELELLQGFDCFLSHLARILHFFFFHFILEIQHAKEGVKIRSDKVAEY